MSVAADAAGHKPALRFSVLLAVLGIVYGDIGTSPLYAFKASLSLLPANGLQVWEVLGVLSLIFWALFLIVTMKYVLLVMRADNRGEGGILALMALAQRVSKRPGARAFLALIGIGGACLFFGDGVITPGYFRAVSGRGAGSLLAASQLKFYVLPISCCWSSLIAVRDAVWQGTGNGWPGVRPGYGGLVFGAIGTDWALIEIIPHPGCAAGRFLPRYAYIALCELQYRLVRVLRRWVPSCWCVTGRRRLVYADMGHFRR